MCGRFLVVLLVAAAIFAAFAESAPSSAPTTNATSAPAEPDNANPDWPTVRGNSRNTGVAGSALPAKLGVRWRFNLGDATVCTAAVADGKVYIGGDNGRFVALELETGALRWEARGDDAIESSPTVIALPVASAPSAATSRGVIRGVLVIFGDDAGTLHACDAHDGQERWCFKTGDKVVSSVNTQGERLVFGSYDGHIYCLRSADGEVLWKYDVHERVHGTPGITGEYVVAAACDAQLHVVRMSDGSAVRQIRLGSVSGSAAALSGARVFIGTYGNQVVGINWQTDDILWRFEDKERGFPFLSSAAVNGDVVIIGGRDKRVRALDANTGKLRWEFITKGRVDSSPVIVGERVFFGSADGNLYGVNLKSGRELWRFESGAAISAAPAVGENCLVIGNEEGVVYCFGAAPTDFRTGEDAAAPQRVAPG